MPWRCFAGMPDTTSKAQYSLAFACANMIIYRRIGVEHISGAGLQDAAVARMLKTHRGGGIRPSQRPLSARALGRCSDRKRWMVGFWNRATCMRRGGPEAPFAPDDVIAKYMEFAAPVLGDGRAVAIRDRILASPTWKAGSAILQPCFTIPCQPEPPCRIGVTDELRQGRDRARS